MREHSGVTVAVISAHEGAATWVKVCRYIEETTDMRFRSFHEYNDGRYRAAHTRLQRLWLRVKTFIIFPMRFLIHARRIAQESDIIVVVSSPFFMPMLVSWVVNSRKTKIIALMYDIYPEALIVKGMLRRGGVGERFIRRRFDAVLRKMHAVVFICEQHKTFVAGQARLPPVVEVIPVSGHSEPFVDHVPTLSNRPVEVLYCGTLGLLHDFSTFTKWLATYEVHGAVAFSFFTSGAAKRAFESDIQALRRRIRPGARILLGGSLPESEWVSVMKRAQVGLVFQDAGAGAVIFPSKVASILASGQALLAIADLESEVAQLITANDCGWVVAPGNASGLQRCFDDLFREDVLLQKRENAFRIGHSLFGKVAVARRWTGLLTAVAGKNVAG